MLVGAVSTPNYELARSLLDAAVLRHEAIASNIANAETPGYRRVDLAPDFAAQLRQAVARGDAPSSVTPRVTEDAAARSVRADGNTVKLEEEIVALGRNAAEHQFLLQTVSSDLRSLRTAITGRTTP